MTSLLSPTYFPNIAHFLAIVHADEVCFEICDNYQKQTLRNRTEIYGANGKLALTVPVNYTQKQRQLYKDVKIANDDSWQKQHFKSIQSAYSMSPFFEYYEADIMPIFKNEFTYLLDLNRKCFDILLDCLQSESTYFESTSFEKQPIDKIDFRHLAQPNCNIDGLLPHTQVFTEKHGFIENLSILDMLFNEGPNTISFLKRHSTDN